MGEARVTSTAFDAALAPVYLGGEPIGAVRPAGLAGKPGRWRRRATCGRHLSYSD